MVDWWWAVIGAAIPAVAVQQVVKATRRKSEEEPLKIGGPVKNPNDIFFCERVCTSKRMLNKVGDFSKNPTPDTCVTVCGVSELDACTDACARTVCANQHHLPNWNDICLRRCQNQCLRLLPGSSY